MMFNLAVLRKYQ